MKEKKVKEPTWLEVCIAIFFGIGCGFIWKEGYDHLIVGLFTGILYLSVVLLRNMAYNHYEE